MFLSVKLQQSLLDLRSFASPGQAVRPLTVQKGNQISIAYQMSLIPYGILNFFSLSSFKGLNWFEGLKRIKIFLQWIWGVPAVLGLVVFFVYNFLHRSLNYEVFFWGIVVLLPILGFELLFRAVVWIVAGFFHSGHSKS
jgi:hypothetical protein